MTIGQSARLFTAAELTPLMSRFDAIAKNIDSDLIDRQRGFADRYDSNHVELWLGAGSGVAAPGIIAGIKSGLIRNLVLSYYTMRNVMPRWAMGAEAMAEYAQAHGVRVWLAEGDAVIVTPAGKAKDKLPDNVLAGIHALGGENPEVSVTESIAKAIPGLLPGENPQLVPHLGADGRLCLRWLEPVKDLTVKTNMAAMGRNPSAWYDNLNSLGLLGPNSVGFSFGWRGGNDAPSYRSLAAAKATLASDYADLAKKGYPGTYLHVAQPATLTDAIDAITQGVLMGVVTELRLRGQGLTLNHDNIAPLARLSAMDPEFTDPRFVREGSDFLADIDERRIFGSVIADMQALGASGLIQQGAITDAETSDALIRHFFGLTEGWQGLLEQCFPSRRVMRPRGAQISAAVAAAIPASNYGYTTAMEPRPYERVIAYMNKIMTSEVEGLIRHEDGITYEWTYRISPDRNAAYEEVTGNEHSIAGYFVGATKGLFRIVGNYLPESSIYSVIHRSEDIDPIQHAPVDEDIKVQYRVVKVGDTLAARELDITHEHYNNAGELIGKGKTKLLLGVDLRQGSPIEKRDPKVLGERLDDLIFEVTPELRDQYVAASGDDNLVHMSDEEAEALGLSGWILHGMFATNVVDRGHRRSGKNGSVDITYKSPMRRGDRITPYRREDKDGSVTVSLLNQKDELLVVGTRKPRKAD